MAQLTLHAFGPPRLERGGRLIDLAIRKAQALIVYLAVTAQPHSRDHLATLLWPECDQREGRGRLRRTLHRLSAAVGDEVLDADGDTVQLHKGLDLWLDCREFRDAVAAGLPASPAHVLASPRVAHLTHAVELYTAEFLAGFTLADSAAFDDWQFFQRESLHQLYGQALEQLVQAHLAGGAVADAITYARRWVALDPLHEAAQRMLMRSYAAAGQQSAAIRQYQECARILEAELGAEPETETTAVYEAIRTRHLEPRSHVSDADRAPTLVSPSRSVDIDLPSLPATHPTLPPLVPNLRPCIGRERDLAVLADLLADPARRLVTLVGPGGVGKTRLAFEVATVARGAYQHGAHVIPLAGVTGVDQIMPAITAALGLAVAEDNGEEQRLVSALRERHLLLVLDTLDHLPGAARVLADLLTSTLRVTLLATSRMPLGLAAEWVYDVRGLAYPADGTLTVDEAQRYGAVQLFVACARQAQHDFTLRDTDVTHVIRLCRLVDGTPLAIELAASWARTLPCEVIADEVARSLDLLSSANADLPERHRSLRAMFEHAWRQLSADEQAALRRLARFQDVFTPGTAEAVAGVTPEVLAALTDRHIVRHVEGGMLRLHPLMRPFATAQRHDTTEPRVTVALGVPSTRFVGRDRELEQLTQLLLGDRETRLLTLTGPGGIGKTRLALEVAAGLGEVFPHGAHVVELAPLAEPSFVPQVVADALGVQEVAGRPILIALTGFLREQRLLLVLDNCEHLVGACAQLVEALLRACPHLRILATSREALGIAAEVTLAVPPLAVPDAHENGSLEAFARSEAVRLFVARARAVQQAFALTEANRAGVTQVCRRLDGIPLAIELAAARVRLMPIEQIVARLDDRFRLLSGGSRTALPRHQTLRALIDWSYDLLTDAERVLLQQLAVFAGGWTLAAAEAVGGDDALDLLGQLVNKSLVVVDDSRAGEARYRMLETIRAYALDRLSEAGALAAARQRHLAYALALAEEAEPHVRGPEQVRWLDRLEAEHGNLRAAFESALATDAVVALRLAAQLLWFWHIRGHKTEGRAWLSQALQLDGGKAAPVTRARALYVAGFLAHMQGDFEQATALLEESLALLRQHPHPRSLAATLSSLGGLALERGDFDRTRALFDEGLALYRAEGDTFGMAECLGGLGRAALIAGDYDRARVLWGERLALRMSIGDVDGIADARAQLGTVAFWQGDHQAARALAEESLAQFRAIGNRWAVGFVLVALGELEHADGDYAAAEKRLTDAIALGHGLGDHNIIAHAQYELGGVARSEGRYEPAETHFGESLALMRDLGNTLAVGATLCALGDVARARGDLAAAQRRFAEALALGREGGHTITITTALAALGKIARGQQDLDLARHLSVQALAERRAAGHRWRAWRREVSDRWALPGFVESLALVQAERGEHALAVRLLGATEAWAAAVQYSRTPLERAERARAVTASQAGLGQEAFAAAWTEGQALSLDQTIDDTLQTEALAADSC